MLVIPDLGGGLAFGEEEQVCADAGVRIEYTVGQPDNCMEVALGEQCLLDTSLDTFSKECSVG